MGIPNSGDRERGDVEAASVVAPGSLRVYLGAAPGVGKTYAMLDEAHRRLDRGTDLVVGLRRRARVAGTRRPCSKASR